MSQADTCYTPKKELGKHQSEPTSAGPYARGTSQSPDWDRVASALRALPPSPLPQGLLGTPGKVEEGAGRKAAFISSQSPSHPRGTSACAQPGAGFCSFQASTGKAGESHPDF